MVPEISPMQVPTPVQMQAIPCIMAGRDGIVLAETVSGLLQIHYVQMTVYTPHRDLGRLLLILCHCATFYLSSHLFFLVRSFIVDHRAVHYYTLWCL